MWAEFYSCIHQARFGIYYQLFFGADLVSNLKHLMVTLYGAVIYLLPLLI